MKNEITINIEQLNEETRMKKDEFRQHQRNLTFSEKMKIGFSLAERDKTIRRAVLLPKQKKEDK